MKIFTLARIFLPAISYQSGQNGLFVLFPQPCHHSVPAGTLSVPTSNITSSVKLLSTWPRVKSHARGKRQNELGTKSRRWHYWTAWPRWLTWFTRASVNEVVIRKQGCGNKTHITGLLYGLYTQATWNLLVLNECLVPSSLPLFSFLCPPIVHSTIKAAVPRLADILISFVTCLFMCTVLELHFGQASQTHKPPRARLALVSLD